MDSLDTAIRLLAFVCLPGATRIVHLVYPSQKNPAERQSRIDTTVYAGADGSGVRTYNSRCFTLGEIRMRDAKD